MTQPLSPGQALHLVNDPERAELARHTDQQQVFVAVEQPVSPTPVVPDPEPAVERGWFSRAWRRLIRSD